MPKGQPVVLQSSLPEGGSLKVVERSLRMLTWQLFFLIALLVYLAMRPQAGRYQFTVAGGEVLVFDTASSRAMALKLEREQNPSAQTTPPPEASPAPGATPQ